MVAISLPDNETVVAVIVYRTRGPTKEQRISSHPIQLGVPFHFTLVPADTGRHALWLEGDFHFEGDESPLKWSEIEQGENLDGLTEEQMETFRRRAVPEPAGPIRDAPELTNDARRDVPTTAICTGFSSEQYKAALEEGYAFLGGFAELRDITWIDMPTSHWPMWSKPKELATIIGNVAQNAAAD